MVWKRGVIHLVLILIMSNLVFSVCYDENMNPIPCPKEPTPQDRANKGDYKDMSGEDFKKIDWNKEPKPDQSKVPSDKIGNIPAKDVDVNKVKDQSKLTYDQLSHGDNYNKIQDKSKLNPAVRNRFLSEKTKKNIKTIINTPTAGDVFENGFWFDNIFSIQIDNTIVNNARNVRYENNKITIDHADSIIINNTFSYNVNNAVIDEVKAGCNRFYDVKDSNFSFGYNVVYVQPTTTLSIEDCNLAEFIFEPGENAQISISETVPTTVEISNGSLVFENETLASNATASLTIDPINGFICLNISPTGIKSHTNCALRRL